MDRKLLEDFLAAIEESERKYNTPELKRQFLQEAGFIDANGELTEYYRSPEQNDRQVPLTKLHLYGRQDILTQRRLTSMDRKYLEDFLAGIEELDKKYNTPELALQLLQQAGIVDANGKLAEYYRSPEQD